MIDIRGENETAVVLLNQVGDRSKGFSKGQRIDGQHSKMKAAGGAGRVTSLTWLALPGATMVPREKRKVFSPARSRPRPKRARSAASQVSPQTIR